MQDHPDHFQLGFIVRTHGVKGDMVAALDTDSPSRYNKLKVVYLEVQGVLKEYSITRITVREKERSAILHLMGIEDMTTAENYLKNKLYLPLSELPKLRGKKFYYHEVSGFEIVDKNLGALGPITTVYDRAEQPVVEFDYQGKKVLFPVHDSIIVKIDREARQFHVNLPDGLVDVYLE